MKRIIKYLYAYLVLILGQNSFAQINLSTQPLLGADSYTRNATSITLLPGFSYKADASVTTPVLGASQYLLNLNISSYPSFVPSGYSVPSSAGCGLVYPDNFSNALVGETVGNFAVSPSGAAIYNVPIYVAPGTANVAPGLSISYNSDLKDGLMGIGWNLNGLSTISRANKTIQLDGKFEAVQLGLNDQFSLDGNRLMPKSGTYGASGATYSTENETFSTIISNGSSGNGPQSFEVTDKYGNKMQYGLGTNSTLKGIGDNTVLIWFLNKVTDEFGNFMDYSYKNLNGEIVIDKIEYTMNFGAGQTTPYNTVSFEYIDKAEKNSFFVAGKEFRNTQLLKTITSMAEGKLARKYVFDYKFDRATLLSKITEIASDGSELRPTTFCWSDPYEQFSTAVNTSSLTLFQSNADMVGLKKVISGDFDGNGFGDVLAVVSNQYRFKISQYDNSAVSSIGLTYDHITPQGNSNLGISDKILASSVVDSDFDGKQEVYLIINRILQPTIYIVQKIEFNGTNAVVTEQPASLLSASAAINPNHTVPHFFYDKNDYTGDAIYDEVIVDPEKIRINSAEGNRTEYYIGGNAIVRSLDFDGDGVMELVILDDQTNGLVIKVLKYVVGNPFLSLVYTTSIPYTGNTSIKLHELIGLGDYNGDGKTDISYLNTGYSELNIIYSTGTTFSNPKKVDAFTAVPIPAPGVLYNISSPDINSDGKNDYIITDNQDQSSSAINNYFSYLSSGDVFIKGASAAGAWTFYEWYTVKLIEAKNWGAYYYYYEVETHKTPVLMHNFDLNGDGNFDAISLRDFTHQKIVLNNITSTRADYISQIVTGLGKQITIGYSNTNTEIDRSKVRTYSNESTTAYALPLVRIKPTKWVVSKVNFTSTFMATSTNQTNSYNSSLANDPQISNTYRYTYSDAIFHREGRGFLGFEKTLVFNTITKIGTENKNTINTSRYISLNTENLVGIIKPQPLSGAVTAYIIDNTKPLSSKTNVTYQVVNAPSVNSFFVAPQSITSKNFLNSIASKTDYVYDLNKAGNVASVNTEYFWKAGDPITYSVNTVYNYQQEGLANNKIYKVKDATVKTAHYDDGLGNTNTRFTEYTYDGLGHLIEISSDPAPYATGKNVKTIFPTSSYNGFGQPTHVELGGDAPAMRKADVVYDSKGRFIAKTINTFGHTNEMVHEPVYGNVIQTKDITGLISNLKYDGLGRIIETTLPNGAINKQSYDYQIPAYANNNRNGVYAITTTNESQPPSTNYFDTYGRMLRNETKGFNNTTVYTDMFYDGVGRLWQQSEPYFSTQSEFLVSTNTFNDIYFRLTANTIGKRQNINNPPPDLYVGLVNTYVYGPPSPSAPTGNHVPYFLLTENQSQEGVKKFINVAGQTSTVQTINGLAYQNSVYTYTNNGQPKRIDLSYGIGNYTPDVTHNFEYDEIGRQTKLIDPSAGTILYEYNAIGELTKQTDGNNNVYTYQYDDLGRLLQKIGSGEGPTNYQYVTSGNGLEQIEKITHANVITDFKYDNLNRPTEYKETLPSSKIFNTKYAYDKYGRVTDYTYPSGFTTKSSYDAQGYLTEIKNAGNNSLIWRLDDVNAINQIKDYTYGNNLQTSNTFDAIHQPTLISNSALTQNYTMNGSLDRTFMESRSITSGINLEKEQFTYDQQKRLSSFVQLSGISPIATTSVETKFDFNGNIKEKDDAGDYVYGNTNKPFTLTGINNPQTTISLNQLNIVYNDFNKVKQINEASTLKQMDFTYGNDEQRLQMDYKINGVNQYTRYYCQNYEREETPSSTFKEWNYVFAPSGLAAVVYNDNGNEKLYYVETDHLGSPIALTNSNNQNIAEEYSFDPWGRRRNPTDWKDYAVNPSNFILKRGFTFHEHIDEFNLINMNGRVYDPVLGRFIQPDNIVQDPDNISTFNRYSYVMNNPLKYIDPSGWGGEGPPDNVDPPSGPPGSTNPYPYGGQAYTLNNGYTFQGYYFTENYFTNGGWTAFSSANSPGYYYTSGGNGNSIANANSPNAFFSLPSGDGGGVVSAPRDGGPTRGGSTDGGSSPRDYGGDGSGSTFDQSMQVMDAINQWNPIANLMDVASIAFTGRDRLGNEMTVGEGFLKAASIIPIGRLGVTANSMSHIFKNTIGHVNPTTITSQGRYLQLFSKVASNPNNLVMSANPAKTAAGVQVYRQTFRNGSQVWVEIFNNQIRDAGVNLIPK